MTPLARGAAALSIIAALTGGKSAPVPTEPTTPNGYVERIDASIQAGSLDVARDLLVRATGHVPTPRLALERAEYALASGLLDVAAAEFTALGPDATVAARADQGLGLARLRLNDNDAAIVALDRAVAKDPSLIRAWIARGVAADRARDWAEADIAYARALGLDQNSATALTNRGYSRLLRGQFAEAATDLQQAIAIDPKLEVARTNLRLARAMAGDYKSAFVGSNKADLARDLNTVGFAAMARGDYGIAESYFTRAMQISPQFDRTAWANLEYLKQLAHKPLEPGAPER